MDLFQISSCTGDIHNICSKWSLSPYLSYPSASDHFTLKQRRNSVWNNVTTQFQLNFDVVPTSCARWVGCKRKKTHLTATT